MIKELATSGDTVRDLCDLYDVSPSGYYDWYDREPSQRDKADKELAEEIKAIHRKSRCNYGSPRIAESLKLKNIKAGKKRVARIMKKEGIKGVQKATYRPQTTDSNHDFPVSPNLLTDLDVDSINQVMASDITYIPTIEGWLYLAAFMDMKSRMIKGWCLRDHMKTELVETAFTQAVFRHSLPSGLIVHSDRGSQYASHSFRNLLKSYNAISSMSGKGNCYDNAAMESFWATLKKDLHITKPFKTKEEARLAIFDYIEVYYNRNRMHSSIGFMSPLDYETKHCA
jgi:putative transposase